MFRFLRYRALNPWPWDDFIRLEPSLDVRRICQHESAVLHVSPYLLTDTRHDYAVVICSSTHIHLTERDCLEVIVVRGDATRIRRLVEKLRRRRGVKQARLTVVSL